MKKTILFTTLMAMLFIIACKKEQPQMTTEVVNPCDCATEVSAEFDMLEISGQTGSIFEKTTPTDTILKNKSVRFLAKDSTANYTWYIGSEVLTDREVIRYFDQTLSGQNIPITLVVKKEPNNNCFPNDDGYDSIVKMLHVSQFPIENPPTTIDYGSIEGTYRVKSEHKIDSFDIVFDVGYFGATQTFDIYNYDGNGIDCVGNAYINNINYRQVWTEGGTGITVCDYLQGDIHIGLNGIVEISFTTKKYNSDNVIETFEWLYIGRKLN